MADRISADLPAISTCRLAISGRAIECEHIQPS